MKKVYSLVLLLSVLVFSLTSCSQENVLYILNWDEYMCGDLIEAFEEEYNCEVVVDIAQSNESMFSKIVSDAAPYDIAIPSDYMIAQMINCQEDGIEAPVIKKIDYTRLSNYSADMFDSKLLELIARDCQGLEGYYVPYFWGSLGIMYNTKNLTEGQIKTIKDKGWAVLFEKELLGDVNIGMYASARDSIASALLYKGYSVNTEDSNELQEASDALAKMNYKAWATDDLKAGVASGKYDLALVYSGDYIDTYITKLDSEAEINFDFYAPSNNNIFFDAMVMPKNSMNEELAYAFIDFMLEFNNACENAAYVGYCPTVSKVYQEMLVVDNPLTDEVEGWEMEEISQVSAYYPGNIKMGEIYKFLGSDTYELYDVIYKRVKK